MARMKRWIIETIGKRTLWYVSVYTQVIEHMDQCEECAT